MNWMTEILREEQVSVGVEVGEEEDRVWLVWMVGKTLVMLGWIRMRLGR